MKTKSLLFTVTLNVVFACSVIAAEPVGTIVHLSGTATATGTDGEIRQLELSSPVYQQDVIKTGEKSKLQIMFMDESVLSMEEKSEMTIDEFVYSPENKSKNSCVLKLSKGMFRTVTAKIAALNPDKFKVKTGLTTVGIRGCEVAFHITERGENIYVLSLPDGKSIVIETPAGFDISGLAMDGVITHDNLIQVIKSGVRIHIEEGDGSFSTPITPEEALGLLQNIAPQQDPQSSSGLMGGITDPPNEQANLNSLQNTAGPAPQEGPPPGQEGGSSGGGSSGNGDTDDPLPNGQPAEPYFVVKENGGGWLWGVWHDAAGQVATVEFQPVTPNYIFSPAQVQTFINDNIGSGCELNANGTAAALVKDGATKALLDGFCYISFLIDPVGPASGVSWTASTESPLEGGGYSLAFGIEGSVDNGVLIGSFESYELTKPSSIVFEKEDIQNPNISANLIGNTTSEPNGMIGHFSLQHPDGTSVQGGFGGVGEAFGW